MNNPLNSPAKIVLLLIVFSILVSPSCIAQQKPQFTQYMFNGLIINPAYAGVDEALSLTFIDRHQWMGVENAPTTQTLSSHTQFKKKHFGVGLSIVNDKIGVHQNLSALTSFAYHLKTGKESFLSMGLQAGLDNARANYSSLYTNSNNDPNLVNSISETYFDVGFGLYFRSPKFHIGLSAPEFIPKRIYLNDTTSTQLSKINLFLFAKYKITLSENLELEPSTLIKYLPDLPVSFDANLNLIYRQVLTIGLSYRDSESVDFLLKAQVTQQLQFGYAYDYPISYSSKLSNGSHEIMANYVFRYKPRNVSSPR